MTRGRIYTFLAILVLSTGVLTVFMTSRAAGDKPSDPKSAPDRPYLVCWGDVDTEDRYVGLFPENFPMPARVTKVLKKEGADVQKGEPLLEFDADQLNLKVREAENGIQAALAEQAKAEGAVRMHTVLVNEADKLWQAKQAILSSKKSEYLEAERLFNVNKIGRKLELDAAQAAVREAELNSEAAKIKWEGLKAEVPTYYVDIARENVKHKQTLKAQAEQARDLLACKAPADGKIIRSFVTEGANFGMQSREPAFWFLKKGPLIVRAEVTQEFAKGAIVGKSATITDDSDETQVWTGTVTKVGEQFLPKRHGGASILDLMPVSDERVLECLVSIDTEPGKSAAPKFGQKVRVTLR